MKARLHFLCLLTFCLAVARVATAQGTAFTYQGVLSQNGAAINGSNDLTFTLYTAASGGSIVGTSNVVNDLVMSNGLFTVTLDFGATPFLGNDRWLQIAVRPGASTGDYTNLLPRQPITATPYALFAAGANASTLIGSIPSTSLAGTYSVAVTLNNAGNVFAGNGSNLTALNASQLTSGTVPAAALGNTWKIGGNAGTTPGTHFLGTTDNQPMDFRVNNQRGLRLEPGVSVNNGPGVNVLGGSSGNFVSNGVIGATLFGGGAPSSSTNQVLADFGAVSGGSQNTAGDVYATVGGGNLNTASGSASVIGGGQANTAAGLRAAIGGGTFNNAPGAYATVPGGSDNNASGNYSFAAGRQAKALHNGAFVWADSTAADFASAANNQFNVRASGGARFVTSGAGLSVDGPVSASFVGNGAGISNVNVATLQQSLGLVVAWGHGVGITNVPPGLDDAVAVAGGFWFSIALRRNGTVVFWGENRNGEASIPAGLNNVVAIGAGAGHCLAVRTDGTVVAWGNNGAGQATVPVGLSNVVAVAGADDFSLALKRDGTVVGWGNVTVPPGLSSIRGIAAAAGHALAVQSNGIVVAWGDNSDGQSTVPAGLTNVVAVAAGSWHSLALLNNGTVTGWGRNNDGQTAGGHTDAVAISAGSIFSLALKSNGTVERWGFSYFGELQTPAGLNNLVAISASGHHACVIKSQPAPAQLALLDDNNTLYGSVNAANLVGTISSAQLPANVALRAGGNTFTGQQTVTGGNVGVGTTGPATALHVVGSGDTELSIQSTGNNRRWTLQASGGPDGNPAFLGGYFQIIDRTAGASRLLITTNGNVGIGTGAVDDKLHVASPSSMRIRAETAGNGWAGFLSKNNLAEWFAGVASGPSGAWILAENSPLQGNRIVVDVTGLVGIGRSPTANRLEVEGEASKTAAGSWVANSDARIKKNIHPVTGALDKLSQVRLVSFHYTDEYRQAHASVEDRPYLNVVAQEFREVFPEHVKSSGEKLADGSEILQVDTYPLTIYSAAAVQELNGQVKQLKNEMKRRDAENVKLQEQNQSLEQRVAALEKLINRLSVTKEGAQ